MRCPNDASHDRFTAVQHIEETYTFDGDGNELDVDTRAQRDGPPVCAECGATAKVSQSHD